MSTESEKRLIDKLFEENLNKPVSNVTKSCNNSHGMLESIMTYFNLNENTIITQNLIDRLEDNWEPIVWNKTAQDYYGLDNPNEKSYKEEELHIDNLFDMYIGKPISSIINSSTDNTHGLLESVMSYLNLNENTIITKQIANVIDDDIWKYMIWNKTAQDYYGFKNPNPKDYDTEQIHINMLFEVNKNKPVANVTKACKNSHGILESIKKYFDLNENTIITDDVLHKVESTYKFNTFNGEIMEWNKTAQDYYGLKVD